MGTKEIGILEGRGCLSCLLGCDDQVIRYSDVGDMGMSNILEASSGLLLYRVLGLHGKKAKDSHMKTSSMLRHSSMQPQAATAQSHSCTATQRPYLLPHRAGRHF